MRAYRRAVAPNIFDDADAINFFARLGQNLGSLVDLIERDDNGHPDAAIERARHFVRVDIP